MIRCRFVLCALVLLALVPAVAHATVLRVKPRVTDPPPDGLSWATSFSTVTEALQASVSGDEVWVAGGVYRENLVLKPGVALYGGFAGGETDRAQRTPATNPTILDGGGIGSVARAGGPISQPSRLFDLTLRNGIGENGGGLFCSGGAVEMEGCTVTGNTANLRGGGVYVLGGTVTLTNTLLAGNAVSTGGEGGGLYATSANVTLVNSAVEGNTGNGVMVDTSDLVITDGTVDGNTAAGVFVRDASFGINGTSFSGNGGAAVYVEDGGGRLDNAHITGNGAGVLGRFTYGAGGGWYPSVSIRNSVLADNNGVAVGGSNFGFHVVNCTIVGNEAGISGGDTDFGIILTNSLVAYNNTGIGLAMVQFSTRKEITFSNVFGNGVDYAGIPDVTGRDGNISADPRLADACGNYHIQPDSPNVDAGSDAAVFPGDVDMDGEARIQGARVDIGADESDGAWWRERTPRVFHVSRAGNDAADGLSWATARFSLGAALAEARCGDEVWVAAGTYPGGISMGRGVALYGGFAGTETERSQRDPKANASVLNGGDPVVDLSRVFTVLDGFTVRGGVSKSAGAGVRCVGGRSVIANNLITDNLVFYDGSPVWEGVIGGGIYAVAGHLRIVDNVISRNRVSGNGRAAGGGLFTNFVSGVLEGNLFLDNTADGSTEGKGGGLYMSAGSMVVQRNVFRGNLARDAGTADNRTGGGGIYVYGYEDVIEIRNNLITGNQVNSGNGGGVSGSGARLVNNTIVGNEADQGGGIFGGGYLTNNIIAFNNSGVSGTSLFQNNLIYGNTAYDVIGIPPPFGKDGNINADPLFRDRAAGDYSLKPGSPAIDAGDDAAVLPGEIDIEGRPRRLGAHVDIGAYEFASPGFFTLADVAGALRIVGGLATDIHPAYDLDAGGSVDLRDAALMVRKVAGLGANP